MKEQEKQIEEIVKNKQWQRRDNYCLRIQKALQYKGTNDNEDVPSILVDFENEIRKEMLPEDSVVLSADEFASLKKYTYKKGSKEMAEKIMQDLKPLLEGFMHTDTGENLYVYKCKQFDVEIKE